MNPLGDLRTAVAFLTRLPVRDTAEFTPARFARAALWFPVVGLLVGGVLGGVRLALDGVGVDPGPATVLALLAAILVTGGLHEDGLADCADALGAHTSRARKLEILRDSRVGTFGALAVAFALLLPFAALAPLSGEDVLKAALVGHALGRWSTLPLARVLPPAQPDGAGALLRVGWLVVAGTTVLCTALVLVIAGPGPGAAALGVALGVMALCGVAAVRSFGGASGDVFGATNKLVELSAYVTLAAFW